MVTSPYSMLAYKRLYYVTFMKEENTHAMALHSIQICPARKAAIHVALTNEPNCTFRGMPRNSVLAPEKDAEKTFSGSAHYIHYIFQKKIMLFKH